MEGVIIIDGRWLWNYGVWSTGGIMSNEDGNGLLYTVKDKGDKVILNGVTVLRAAKQVMDSSQLRKYNNEIK